MEKNYMELKIRVAANFLCRQKPNTIDIPVNKSSINYDSKQHSRKTTSQSIFLSEQ